MYQSTSPMQISSIKGVSSLKGRQNERPVSQTAKFVRWLQLKNYQYEVTMSLYMLTPTEKIIFNLTLLVLTTMITIAAIVYLPNHISIIYQRVVYYIEGSNVSTIADAVKTTRAALAYHTTKVAAQTTERVLSEL